MTVAIFDGYCVICQQTRKAVRALDWLNKVEFIDLHQHDVIEARFPWLDHDKAMGEIHVVDSKDAIYPGYFGVRRMLRDLPIGLPFWVLLQIPGMDWIGQRVYRWIAKNRYAINKFFGVDLNECENGACKIPS